jgi:hypothetical protein
MLWIGVDAKEGETTSEVKVATDVGLRIGAGVVCHA